jgi:hypothetical protein
MIEQPKRDGALHELIAVRAFELWESHGRPDGHDLTDWRQAEDEIMTCVGESVKIEASTVQSASP